MTGQAPEVSGFWGAMLSMNRYRQLFQFILKSFALPSALGDRAGENLQMAGGPVTGSGSGMKRKGSMEVRGP